MKFVAPEQAPEQAEIIRNTPFWPDVDLSVYCWARAMLNERYQDYDATASGVKRGEELAEASGDLWRDARWAISRVQDAPHCTVELI